MIAGLDRYDLRERLRPGNVVISLRQLGIGACIAKKVAENDVSRIFERSRKLGVEIGLLLQLRNGIFKLLRAELPISLRTRARTSSASLLAAVGKFSSKAITLAPLFFN